MFPARMRRRLNGGSGGALLRREGLADARRYAPSGSRTGRGRGVRPQPDRVCR